ncbi:DNA ligase [Marinomonas pollencensis]|uniref:DNA ligase-1 n=1 Tax=Marinomonas pollencensis TaxID=491954 RepID=A0A3E0D9U9_9GAMM|nr:DNA ligase [Marinomonas pollencensis]REG79440.1 DNA ligase-1 [Marinomonas pollencensis]
MNKPILRLCCFVCFVFFYSSAHANQPAVQLAKTYSDDLSVSDFLISEKYDGVRAIWTGNKLVTRAGNPIHAPIWFTERLPNVWLDGELWSKHNDFQFIASATSKQVPIDHQWRQLKYMVFDAPDYQHTFLQRSQRYLKLIDDLNLPFVKPVEQFTVATNEQLAARLTEYINQGAEGLILHRKSALFRTGRSDNLLKLKPFMDAEARVVGVTLGKGKYRNQMGALLVEMPSGRRFKIGSGFTDAQRANPPQVGSIITYQYHGYTARGIPRFASFLRVRSDHP